MFVWAFAGNFNSQILPHIGRGNHFDSLRSSFLNTMREKKTFNTPFAWEGLQNDSLQHNTNESTHKIKWMGLNFSYKHEKAHPIIIIIHSHHCAILEWTVQYKRLIKSLWIWHSMLKIFLEQDKTRRSRFGWSAWQPFVKATPLCGQKISIFLHWRLFRIFFVFESTLLCTTIKKFKRN